MNLAAKTCPRASHSRSTDNTVMLELIASSKEHKDKQNELLQKILDQNEKHHNDRHDVLLSLTDILETNSSSMKWWYTFDIMFLL